MRSGYFFDGSKPGGLTIHPSTGVLPDDVYLTRSTSPNVTRASTSSFTRVSCVSSAGPRPSEIRTTSAGNLGAERTAAATRPFFAMEKPPSMWVPVVMTRGAPALGAK